MNCLKINANVDKNPSNYQKNRKYLFTNNLENDTSVEIEIERKILLIKKKRKKKEIERKIPSLLSLRDIANLDGF